MKHDTKTLEELEREIAYFEGELRRKVSPDRVDRAQRAIRMRQRALVKVRALVRVPHPHGPGV